MSANRLPQLLIRRRLVAPGGIEEALQRQVVFGGSLGTNLLELEVISEADLLAILAEATGLPVASKADIDAIPQTITDVLPLLFAETYHLVPFFLDAGELGVLVHKGRDEDLFARIAQRLSVQVTAKVTCEIRLHYAMHRLYGTALQPRFEALLRKLDGTTPMAIATPDKKTPAAETPSGATNTTTPAHILTWGLSTTHVHPQGSDQNARGLRLRNLLTQLDEGHDRDAIVDVLLGATLSVFEFAGIFLVQDDMVHGWRATSPEATQMVARAILSLNEPSVFATLHATHGHYLGPLPQAPANTTFLSLIGRAAPRTAFLAPIRVGGKVPAILYADNGPDQGVPHRRVTALLLFTQRTGVALERLIRQQRERAGALLAGEPDIADAPGPATSLPTHEEVLGRPPMVIPGSPTPTHHDTTAIPIPATADETDKTDDETLWSSVQFDDIEIPQPGDLTGADGDAEQDGGGDMGEGLVAFPEVTDSAQESLDDWEDVLYDTTVAKEDAPADPARPPERAAGRPQTTWEEVLTELDATATIVPTPGPTTVEVAGERMDERLLLLEGLDAQSRDVHRAAIEGLLRAGDALDDTLRDRFPGNVIVDPFALNATLPHFEACSGLLALLKARGANAAGVVLPHMDSPERHKRFFAIYYLLTVHVPEGIPALAQRLYDTEPQNRSLAADSLRRYTREEAYRRIVTGLRAQLQVPVLATQVATTQILAQLREPSAVPSLIPLVVAPSDDLAQVANSALAVLTGQSFGRDLTRWQQWWQGNYNRARVVWLLEGLANSAAGMRRVCHNELVLLSGQNVDYDPNAPESIRRRGVEAWYAWLRQVSAGAPAPSSG